MTILKIFKVSLRWRLVGLLVVPVLTACGSSPPVSYYSLHPMDVEIRPDSDSPVIVGLGPIQFPDYLNRSQIILRGSNAEIRIDEYNLWVEPLDVSVHRILAVDIDNLLPDVAVIVFPYEAAVQRNIDYRLLGDVSRFEASESGHIVLEVQWTVATRDDEILIGPRRNRYEAQSAEPKDTNSVVSAMNDVLGQFGREVADRLEAALAQ